MQKKTSPSLITIKYRNTFIDVYRDELYNRYSPVEVKKIKKYEDFNEEKIIRLRDFFLTHLYPDSSLRNERDLAFENLGSVLVSPKKMIPLTTQALGSVFKLGFQLPAAIKAAWRTLDVYSHSHDLEKDLLEVAIQKDIPLEDIQNRESLRSVMRDIAIKKIIRFQEDILKLFESLSNVKLLRIALGVMENSLLIMKKKQEVYSQDEIAGLNMGLSMLRGGLTLFEIFTKEEIKIVLDCISTIEKKWFTEIIEVS